MLMKRIIVTVAVATLPPAVAGCEETAGPLLRSGVVYVAVAFGGEAIEGVEVEMSNENVGTSVDTTDANGIARFPVIGPGTVQVLVAIQEGRKIAPGFSNPSDVRVGNGEHKFHHVPLAQQ